MIERSGKRGRTFAIRFTLPSGERRQARLGKESDGWTRRRAEEELQAVLADMRRGRPNDLASPPTSLPDPMFAAFAYEWFERVRGELRPNTVADYDWQLVRHVLPWFGGLPLSAITSQQVDRWRQAKVREGKLGTTSINKCLTRIAQILEVAVEYGLIDRNPAKGKNRRLKAAKYRGTFLDGADAIAALLDAAGELDAHLRSQPYRRALLATLVFAGLRIDEALSLKWRHVSLPARTLRVAQSKTDAGERVIDVVPALVDELLSMRARASGDPDALVFATATGGKHSASNVRNRLLASAVEGANAKLAKVDRPPLPEPLTPHSLRRTYVSIPLTLGEPVPYVMEQAGHTDSQVTLGIYARVMRRSEGDRERLRGLVDGTVSARFGADRVSEPEDIETADVG
ncbi:MAG TPA: site-specific integrase [Solirubrobacteraceae bacterium]